MKIAVVGMGYVGTVSAACFAAAGHEVWGVDINTQKIASIREGSSPIVEPKLGDRIAQACLSGRLTATGDLQEALCDADACFIAVATPSSRNGDIDTSHLLRA